MAAKKISKVSLGDLVKQVPKNQKAQFNKFRDMSLEYQRRVSKLPSNLPKIDWEYYRKNVRPDYVKMVEEFQVQYEDLQKVFAARYETLDLSKYFEELEKQKIEVQKEIEDFKKASNEQIALRQKEIEEVKARVPYGEMTMEEFCILVPEKSPYCPCQGRETFWPFDMAEQKPGPVGMPDKSTEGGDPHQAEAAHAGKKDAKKDSKKIQAKTDDKTEGKSETAKDSHSNKETDSDSSKNSKAKPKD